MSMSYIALIVVTLIIGLGAQFYVNSQIKRYQRVPVSTGLTGAQAAAAMLQFHGVSGVTIQRGAAGQDFFDPRTNSVTLDPDAYDGTSITATATACHEVGHACQFAQGYTPMKVRSAMVPVVNFTSNAWMFILIAGFMLQISGLVTLAIIFYACAVLFSVVTLPVEFNASRRAIAYMNSINMPEGEKAGSFSVLRACAFTYVAAALTSILQLLWLLGNRE